MKPYGIEDKVDFKERSAEGQNASKENIIRHREKPGLLWNVTWDRIYEQR